MYRNNEKQMILPHEFFLPFAGKLNSENRWCKLASMIPWPKVEQRYIKKFGNLRVGQKAYSVRLALGALIIQNIKSLSDRDAVVEISENPYLQYFIGLPGFIQESPFDPSLMVHFRKRLGKDIINEINEMVARSSDDNDNHPPDGPEPSTEEAKAGSSQPCNEEDVANKGKLILDATCVPTDIRYPTDTRLLNDAREALEEIVDVLHEPHIGVCKKPRTYRNRARRDHLRFERKKRHTKAEIRKAIGKQLRYIRRDLEIVSKLAKTSSLTRLSARQYRNLLVCHEVHRQQLEMYVNRKHQVDDRIVSLHMPFVRPIVRGKSNVEVEFGPKLAISMVDGLAFMEHLSFDAFNESKTLKDSLEKYRARFGFYPQQVLADKIYRNRENLKLCKELGIRLSGPPLGRPANDQAVLKAQLAQEREDTRIRNSVEAKFGEGKRFYGLGRIMTRLPETCETVIAMQLFVMNLEHKLRILFAVFSRSLFQLSHRRICGFSEAI